MGKSFFNITVVLQLLLMTVSLISGHFGPHFGQSGLGPRPLNQFLTPGSQRSFLYLSDNKPFHYDNITNFVVFGKHCYTRNILYLVNTIKHVIYYI